MTEMKKVYRIDDINCPMASTKDLEGGNTTIQKFNDYMENR